MVEDVKNGKSVEQIINNAEKLQKKTFNIFSVEDASGMKAGGRITSAILKVINTLKFKPIIRFDNKNEYAGVTRNYTSGIKKMVKRASK
jgi:fatty acid-binding protein DegV